MTSTASEAEGQANLTSKGSIAGAVGERVYPLAKDGTRGRSMRPGEVIISTPGCEELVG